MARRALEPEDNAGPREARAAASYTIAALTKALDIVDVLDAAPGLSLTEVALRAGLNRPTAFRILANLEERGYVEREAASGAYRPGVRLLQLGLRAMERLDLRALARPALDRLRAAFEETVNLAVPRGDRIVYIDMLEAAWGLRMTAAVGAEDDLYSTALGRAILSRRPAAEVARYLAAAPFPRKTERTMVEAAALRAELARSAERGYAIDDEENEAGARCVGVAILDHRGLPVAALSVSGPIGRLTADRVEAIAAALIEETGAIAARLGYEPPPG